jgi:hypothetical protein
MPRATRSDLNTHARDTALKLRLQGYSLAYIGRALGGLSRARVHTLLKDRPNHHIIKIALTDAELDLVKHSGGRPWLRKVIGEALKRLASE